MKIHGKFLNITDFMSTLTFPQLFHKNVSGETQTTRGT